MLMKLGSDRNEWNGPSTTKLSDSSYLNVTALTFFNPTLHNYSLFNQHFKGPTLIKQLMPDYVSTWKSGFVHSESIGDSAKLDLIGSFDLGHFFETVPAASKNNAHFKSGQK